MTAITCRYVPVKCCGKQGLLALVSKGRDAFFSRRRDFSGTEINYSGVVPVKLAFSSYESTTEQSTEAQSAPVMIMHGLFGSKNNWNTLSKAIHQRTKRKVIAVDARNHGDSPHSPEVSYEHMASDLVNLLKDLDIKRVIFVGHSMGGSAVMYAALNFSELVEKLVVVDMSPVRTSPELTRMMSLFHAMESITLDDNLCMSKARKSTDEQLSKTINSVTLRQFLLTNLVKGESGNFKWRVNLPVLKEYFQTQIARFPDTGSKSFHGPTLFIGGSNSDYIKVEDHAAIKSRFPAAEFQYIAGAGHWLHAEKPAEFLDILTTFINRKVD